MASGSSLNTGIGYKNNLTLQAGTENKLLQRKETIIMHKTNSYTCRDSKATNHEIAPRKEYLKTS